jgi:hypothetical protein
VCLDLAPGIEMLYNISRDVEAGREFFTDYADRIVFGTDLASRLNLEEAGIRAGIVFRWLETADTFRVPDEADFLLGPPEDGIVHGMALPTDALSKIYTGNFTRIVGAAPRELSVSAARDLCRRIATVAETISGTQAGATEAGRVADMLNEPLR